MGNKTGPITWKASSADAVVEGESYVTIECRRPFMVGGNMALPGQQVLGAPEHAARSLVKRGRAEVIQRGD